MVTKQLGLLVVLTVVRNSNTVLLNLEFNHTNFIKNFLKGFPNNAKVISASYTLQL